MGVLGTEITAQRRTGQVERFMADLGVTPTIALDAQVSLEAIARATVPFLADWCMIDMVGQTPQVRLSAVVHADPVQQAVARELLRRYPPPLGQVGPLALPEGRTMIIPALTEAQISRTTLEPDQLALIQALHLGTAILVPLVVNGTGIGVLALARTVGAPAYTPNDLALAEELARRAAGSIEKLWRFTAAAQSRAVTEEAVRVRDTFFSIAAHELRTPLTTLLGRAQLLQKWLDQTTGADPRNLRSMRIIVEQAQRLNRMITALLDASRIQSGRFSIDPVAMDLRALVCRVVDETSLTVTNHTLSLSTPETPVRVTGDEVRLEQVFLNLVSNAIKYSPGGGEVRIEVACGNGKAVVTVSDHGIGIPASARDQLFMRFYRATNAEAMGISGLGIGLFVVNEIVELHGGQIAVASIEGEGSTFSVVLPLLT